jgi:hypothetical protein
VKIPIKNLAGILITGVFEMPHFTGAEILTSDPKMFDDKVRLLRCQANHSRRLAHDQKLAHELLALGSRVGHQHLKWAHDVMSSTLKGNSDDVRAVSGSSGSALPPAPRRWTVRRKADLVKAVRNGSFAIEEICTHYQISADEFLAWERDFDRHGMPGLRVTRLQIYRTANRADSGASRGPGEKQVMPDASPSDIPGRPGRGPSSSNIHG